MAARTMDERRREIEASSARAMAVIETLLAQRRPDKPRRRPGLVSTKPANGAYL